MRNEEIFIVLFSIGVTFYAGYHIYKLRTIIHNIAKRLDTHNLLAYQKYAKTIIIFNNGNTIKSFTRACEFFTLEKLLKDDGLNLRLYLAIPSLLVGLGVLGTFIGFSFTVWSVGDLLDSDNQLESMKKLFASVKIAFASSVAGMLWSFIFSKYEKIQLHKLEEKINIKCSELDGLHYQSHDEYIRSFIGNVENTLKDNIEQTFSIINSNLGKKISDLLKEPADALKIQSENFGKQLTSWETALSEQNKVLVDSTAQLAIIPAALKMQLTGIADSFAALDNNIGITIGRLTNANDEANSYIQKWLNAAKLQSDAIVQQENAVRNINTILAFVPAMAQELDNVNKAFEKAVKSFQKMEKTLQGNFGSISQVLASIPQLDRTTKNLQISVEQFGNNISSERQDMRLTIDTLEKSIKVVFQGLDSTIEQRLERTNSLLNDYFSAIDKLSEKIVKTYATIKN